MSQEVQPFQESTSSWPNFQILCPSLWMLKLSFIEHDAPSAHFAAPAAKAVPCFFCCNSCSSTYKSVKMSSRKQECIVKLELPCSVVHLRGFQATSPRSYSDCSNQMLKYKTTPGIHGPCIDYIGHVWPSTGHGSPSSSLLGVGPWRISWPKTAPWHPHPRHVPCASLALPGEEQPSSSDQRSWGRCWTHVPAVLTFV